MKAAENPRSIRIEHFRYELPDDRIALYPAAERDASKLVEYRQGELREYRYRDLPELIPSGYTLVFNNTRVVQARLAFRKPTGGALELFCLEPDSLYPDITSAMLQQQEVYWICLVGGAAKWKDGQVLELVTETGLKLEARLAEKRSGEYRIHFSWTPATLSFAEVLQLAGKVPIPPYIKRAADSIDEQRYQTVYAATEGSVAAPTAGLHFTEALLKRLTDKNIRTEMVTLHVGAGTFQPVKAESMSGHEMHAEFIDVSRQSIQHLLEQADRIIAVGTTSLRTLESLYWMGVKAHFLPTASIQELSIRQWEVYDEWSTKNLSAREAFITYLDG